MRRALAALVLPLIVGAVGAADVLHAQTPALEERRTVFWQSLGDPLLESLIDSALEANRDLQAATARIGAARSARTHAALDLAPAVTAAAAYNRQRLSSALVPGSAGRLPEQELWDAGLQLSWEIDVFGRGRRTLSAQGSLLDAAESDARDVAVLVASAVAQTYFELRGALQRRDVALRNAENQRRTLELTEVRLEAGRGTALDTERAQAQLSSTLAEIPLLEAAIRSTQHRLAVLLGREPESIEDLLIAADLPELPALAVTDAGAVVRQRPDVRAAADRAAAGDAYVGAARAAYLPRLAIAGTAGYTAGELDGLGRNGPPRYAVGPVLSWPLLDIGRVRTDVDAAQARRSEAAAQHQQTTLRAHEELETARTAYAAARERLELLERAAAASVRATEIARLRFEEGTTDFLEVLDAERRQLEAQDRLAAGRIDTARWLVSLYRASGGLVTAEQR